MVAILDQFGKSLTGVNRITRGEVSDRYRSRLRAKYDAAQTTDENERHWANADALAPNMATNPGVRRTVRNRARYECQQSNSYARGMTLTLANDCVGTGPRLQLQTDDAEANRRVEQEFTEWACSINLAEKLRTMRIAKAIDGEAFGILSNNPRATHAVTLDLRLVETDQVTTPHLTPLESGAIDGVRFDRFNNPIEYDVLRSHPGGDQFGSIMDLTNAETIKAADMIHLFRADRPGQLRGISEFVTALPLFAQLRRYSLAVLAAAEVAAATSGVVYTDSPALGESDNIAPMEVIETELRSLLTMPAGWKVSQLKAEQPITTYKEFVQAILTEAARCVLMPRNVASGDSSEYNYASGRLDHQAYFKANRVERSYFELRALDRILAAWLSEAALIEGLLPQQFRNNVIRILHSWNWDGEEHVDPKKESDAAIALRNAGMLTDAEYFARQGYDWESQYDQLEKENKGRAARGLPPIGQQAAAVAVADRDDEDE